MGKSIVTIPSPAAVRGATRYVLMMRVAKLATATGELACIIRDVSETGVRLRLFHALPSTRHFALVTGTGEPYFVQLAWEAGGEAGFQFSAPIDVGTFLSESAPDEKRQLRLATRKPVLLSVKDCTTEATIRDLSQEGARLECAQSLSVGQHIRLRFGEEPEFFATVRWLARPYYGVVFQAPLGLSEIAQLVWSAYPAERTEPDDGTPCSPVAPRLSAAGG